MRKRLALGVITIFLSLCPFFGEKAFAEPLRPLTLSREGAITPELRQKLMQSFSLDGQNKMRLNAVSNNNIKNIALNNEVVKKYNKLFSYRIKTGKITNQDKSGRCWIFAALNILRPQMIQKLKIEHFEFSQNYLFFWDKIEKSNIFLESIIATADWNIRDARVKFLLEEPFADGGQWNYAVDLINKYGVVPKEAMKETENSLNSAIMNEIITSLLRKDASILRSLYMEGRNTKELRLKKEEMLREIFQVLIYCLGIPPQKIEFRYEDKDRKVSSPKILTPLEFYRQEVGINLDDYICLYSCPNLNYNELYQIDMDRNMVEERDITFINVNMKDMKAYALKSVLNNDPVWFGADMGKDISKTSGIMAKNLYNYSDLLGVDIHMPKSERILYYDTTISHAMVIMGVDVLNGVPIKWLVENSWGEDKGDVGYFTMYEDWFDEFVYQAIIHKKYLPGEMLEILKTEPVILPYDDPMRDLIICR